MTHVEALGRDAGRVRSKPAARPVDAAVFQIVPGALAGEVRRDGSESRAEDRARQEAVTRHLTRSRTMTLKQSASRAKQHRIAMLKHRRKAEDVLGKIALAWFARSAG